MTKISSLAFTAAAVLLTFSMATAADEAEAEQPKPAVTNTSAAQPKPQENSTPTTAPDNTPAPKEEPACDQ